MSSPEQGSPEISEVNRVEAISTLKNWQDNLSGLSQAKQAFLENLEPEQISQETADLLKKVLDAASLLTKQSSVPKEITERLQKEVDRAQKEVILKIDATQHSGQDSTETNRKLHADLDTRRLIDLILDDIKSAGRIKITKARSSEIIDYPSKDNLN